MEARQAELEFTASVCALTLLRHLTDHAGSLPLAVAHRIGATNGGAATLVPLLLRPPWERRVARGGGAERWDGSGWMRLSPLEARALGSAAAQAWLLLHNLLLHPVVASKLELTEDSKEVLLQLRPRLTAHLLDQLPVLAGVQRFLDALAVGSAPGDAAAPPPAVLIEQPPRLRAALLTGIDWAELAAAQKHQQFCAASAKEAAAARLASFLEAVDFLCEARLGGEGDGGPSAASASADPPRINNREGGIASIRGEGRPSRYPLVSALTRLHNAAALGSVEALLSLSYM